MEINKEKINVLMCSSDLSVKGGMVSVVKNYIDNVDFKDFNLIYIPTHIEKNGIIKSIYFINSFLKIVYFCIFKRIKIVHLHVSERGSFYRKALIVKLCNILNIKVILHHHGAEFEEFYVNSNSRKKKYINKIISRANVNIVLSEKLAKALKNKVTDAKIEILYNAVPTYKHNPYNKNANKILFLGRIGNRKGIYDLVEAIKNLDSKISADYKLYICGDGEIDKIKEKIKELNIEQRIEYIGWISKERRLELMNEISINILPSYNEGLPMTILETMAYGIPNISTNIASIPEVILHDKNGYLIEPGDIDKLEECIINMIKDDNLRIKFSKESFATINNGFSLENHILQLCSIWEKLCSRY